MILFVQLVFCLGFTLIHGKSMVPMDDPAFELTIFHVNDIHAHFEEVNVYTGRCKEEMADAGECYGGVSRMFTKLKELQDDPGNDPWLFLNAGDYYQGTIWYTLFDWEPVAQFANLLNYTAMSLGNHEFDDGAAGIVPFASQINFPLLAANLEETGDPYLSDHYTKSIVLDVKGVQVGIIGYITQWTTEISQPDDTLVFLEEIESVRVEAQRLKASGVEILIALGHGGYEEVDLLMAEAVEDIDIIVGGHSHTFLYTGPDPSVEPSEGPYPTYVAQASGKVVPVVQAYCYSKYMGHLKLNFGDDGELLKPVNGVGVSHAEVIMLDASVPKDPYVEELMDPWRELLEEYTTPIGSTDVHLKRLEEEEWNIGDCICDAMLASFEDTTVGFLNNGGIRADILPGEITGEDIFNTLPFNNTVDRLVMTGADIKYVLEDYAEGLCADASCYPGTFLQMSGIKVVYDIREDNAWDRVTSMVTLCEGVDYIPIGQASPDDLCAVDLGKNYSVATGSYLADGGSKNVKLKGHFSEHEKGESDYDAFERYVINNSPITQMVEGRITINYYPGTFVNEDPEEKKVHMRPSLLDQL